MPDEEFELRVYRFEKAWRLHGPCEIDDYLGHPFERASPGRDRLLVELICVDLEFRWRNPGGGSQLCHPHGGSRTARDIAGSSRRARSAASTPGRGPLRYDFQTRVGKRAGLC